MSGGSSFFFTIDMMEEGSPLEICPARVILERFQDEIS